MRVLKELCSSVKTIIADGGYRGELAETLRKTFGYVVQVIGSRDLDPFVNVGLLRGLSLGLITTRGFVVITS
jgi:hypothetical protein